ncbi:MAG TPA: phytanoyl-CoA dioxygenase family protein [Pyrinomonadaceae bacterium]|jgi:ectoine hydroxylase-related dioxygenase (phytanoyl-CoA dioxygenase family)|nr:phytanoyl-CoA dioxygenase family protein [Pyrinomonadaceae bacterium]
MNPGLKESGFRVEESILPESECERLAAGLSSSFGGRGRAGARNLMRHPSVASLASDERLLGIARRALGVGGAMPYRATLFEKSERASWLVAWHQDTALPLEGRFEAEGWGQWSRKAGVTYARAPSWALARVVALRVHLDASARENGPLKVIPGSHRMGVMASEDVAAFARAGGHVECLVGRGGVLAMSPLLVHASSKSSGGGPRRVLHLEYSDALELAPGVRLAIA